MTINIAKMVEDFITPFAESIGLKIADVEYTKKSNGMNLTIYIYKEQGSITINDCERLHKLIDTPLDELNPTNNKQYTLNVSSLGLDRPIKTQKDFKMNMGNILTVKLYEKKDGKKEIEGKLFSYDDNSVSLLHSNGSIIKILLTDAAKISQKIYI